MPRRTQRSEPRFFWGDHRTYNFLGFDLLFGFDLTLEDFDRIEDPVPFIHFRRTSLLVAALIAALAGAVWSQRQATPLTVPPADRSGLGAAPTDEDEASTRLAHDMAKKANVERHTALKNDTEKLLKLAVELKADVDKSNENLLSVDVVKKAEEIEKLAHSVKDKMKGPN
jgi:hypothetical protein